MTRVVQLELAEDQRLGELVQQDHRSAMPSQRPSGEAGRDFGTASGDRGEHRTAETDGRNGALGCSMQPGSCATTAYRVPERPAELKGSIKVPSAWLGFNVRVARGATTCATPAPCAPRPRAPPAAAQDGAGEPDAHDRQPGTAMVLCRDKADRPGDRHRAHQRAQPARARGAARSSVTLPDWLAARPRAEITRLAVVPGADPLMRPMLMKASYLYCAREPGALDGDRRAQRSAGAHLPAARLHRRAGTRDACRWRMPAACRTASWRSTSTPPSAAGGGQHGLYPFMVETFHPDLQLFPNREQPADWVAEAA